MEATGERSPAPAPPGVPWGRRLPRRLLWTALIVLLVVAQSLLVALTVAYESTRAQEQSDAAAAEVAAEVRSEVLRAVQDLQVLVWNPTELPDWTARASVLLQNRRELLRVERRDPRGAVVQWVDSPFTPALFARMTREELGAEAQAACNDARRSASPAFSRSYFVPLPAGQGVEAIEVCLPLRDGAAQPGYVVAMFSLAGVLDAAVGRTRVQRHELSIVEGDGSRLARAGAARGAAVYVADRVVDLPGQTLLVRADSAAGRPSLIPNVAVALVLGLSIGLFGVVLALVRDVRRRSLVERALAETLAFRRAMEDSLSTGLRARDLQGRITYVNPAFCAMVGYGAEELRALVPPPYWPPDQVAEYERRQAARQAAPAGGAATRAGFESVFRRRSGERFPVMIYEAPLVDGHGRHAGWMSAVVDLSEQRRVEELSRQQQERLQASARLATVGEMASLLSHELNQPLAAIASYASGSTNLLDAPDADTPALLRQGLERIAEQAERAGRVIKSVHDFVRRREHVHEAVGVDRLFDAVLPLVRLQARKSGTRVEVDLPQPAPKVRCDRTLVEQVLLNLARNGIQAMEADTPPEQRVLVLAARRAGERRTELSVTDAGKGIAPEVAARLFTPFFSTRAEGMGLGLSLCRTVAEQHGGTLEFDSPFPASAADGTPAAGGTRFRFTLPSAGAPALPPAER